MGPLPEYEVEVNYHKLWAVRLWPAEPADPAVGAKERGALRAAVQEAREKGEGRQPPAIASLGRPRPDQATPHSGRLRDRDTLGDGTGTTHAAPTGPAGTGPVPPR